MRKFVMLLLVSLLILFFTPMTAFAQSCWVRLSWNKYGSLDNESEVTLKRFVAGGSETVDLMLAEPVPDPGKYFQGWRDDATNTLLKDSVVTVTKVQYYTAIFGLTGYAIAFDFQDGNLPLSDMKSFGDEIPQPDPTRDSLEFGGWYTDAQCTGERVSFPCTVTGDITFYAKWTSTYDVRFLDEEGAQIGDAQKVEHGKFAKAPDDPAKEGHTFAGWRNGTDAPLSGAQIDGLEVTDTVEYTAKFNANFYDVRFYDEEENQVGETQQVEHGKSAKAPDDLIKEGHTFAGWRNGTDAPLSGAQIDGLEVTDTVEYTAKFNANFYDVRFYDEEENQVGETQQVEHGKSAKAPDDLIKEGHTFAGWSNGTDTPLSGAQIQGLEVTDTVEYTAKFNANIYDVRFYDEEENQVGETQQVEHGKSAKAPDDLIKEGHTFAGWSNGTDAPLSGAQIQGLEVTDTVEYTAKFNANIYDVRFFDEEENQVGETQQVEHGKSAKAPDDLIKEGHTFAGWSNGTDAPLSGAQIQGLEVTDIVEYTAKFNANIYDVRFLDEEENQVGETQHVEHGKSATAPDDPAMEGHTFAGWRNGTDAPLSGAQIDGLAVTDFVDYTAEFSANVYDVRFLDEEENQVGETQHVEHGKSAKAPDDPAKEGHAFTGWRNGSQILKQAQIDDNEVVETVDYTAVFGKKFYVVAFKSNGVIETKSVEFSALIPEPDEPTHEGHDFAGWLTDDGSRWRFETDKMPAGDITLNAHWNIRKFTVAFYERDGVTPIGSTQTVNWDSAAAEETAPNVKGCTFDGWVLSGSDDTETDSLTNVRENIKAVASCTRNDYTVTFIDEWGQVIGTVGVSAGGSAKAPNAPDKEGHSFIGWNTPLNNIADNTTASAQYEINTYTVRFLDDNGGELNVQTVNWNTAANAPVLPERDGYTFIGWDVPFDKVTSDLTVSAQYRQNSALDISAGELEESNNIMTDMSDNPNEVPDASDPLERAGNGEMVMLAGEAVPAAHSNRDVISGLPSRLENRLSLLHGHSETFIIVLGFLAALVLGMSFWVVKVKKRR